MLLYLNYSLKASQATILPLDNADLATHLLRMCPANMADSVRLTENTIPVSTSPLLLVLKNIENNTELDAKLPSMIKLKGNDGKCKMELMNSCIPKKPRRWAGLRSTAFCAEARWAVHEP